MFDDSYALADLSEATGIEARTIRSYIERGLLPGALTRGRAATYSAEHLTRLQLIQSLRRARPGISLTEIRILLQQLTPDQARNLVDGSITATSRVLDDYPQQNGVDDAAPDQDVAAQTEPPAAQFTGVERINRLLQPIVGSASGGPNPKTEAWHRIAVTPDVELSVRTELGVDQIAAFRELAIFLRRLLEDPTAWIVQTEESQ